jgi:hypothetical protein
VASTAGQTVRAHLAASCLPCITLGQAPTSRHTHSFTQTAFSTMAIQCGVVFKRATKIELFLSRLSRAGLLRAVSTYVFSRGLHSDPEERGHLSNQLTLPCTSTAHEFVSIQLAVPRVKLASRQSPVAYTMNDSRCIGVTSQTSRYTWGGWSVFHVAIRSTNT